MGHQRCGGGPAGGGEAGKGCACSAAGPGACCPPTPHPGQACGPQQHSAAHRRLPNTPGPCCVRRSMQSRRRSSRSSVSRWCAAGAVARLGRRTCCRLRGGTASNWRADADPLLPSLPGACRRVLSSPLHRWCGLQMGSTRWAARWLLPERGAATRQQAPASASAPARHTPPPCTACAAGPQARSG